jgi:Sulfotransferase family
MIDYGHNPIFVTGIERSGSSIIAKIIALTNVFSGNCTPMYENKLIREYMVNYYQLIGADVKAQYPLPLVKHVPDFQSIILDKMYQDGFGDDKYWVYKSSRLVQTWKLWHNAFPTAKWIIVRRKPTDIIYSCQHTSFMTAFKNENTCKLVGVNSEKEGWAWWIKQHEHLFIDMIQAGLNCKVVWPDRIQLGDYSQIEEMLNWLGLVYDLNKIKKEIEPLIIK